MVDVESLTLHVNQNRFWDEANEVFIDIPEGDIVLKHTLVSISKWESKWHKGYLSHRDDITSEEALDYIKFMTVNEVDPMIYFGLTERDFYLIKEYIENPMTGTHFSEYAFKSNTSTMNGETITGELVYYWMISFQIPFTCENWHFNRLMTLIKICSVKSEKPKKMSKAELAARNRVLNAQRRAKYNTKG